MRFSLLGIFEWVTALAVLAIWPCAAGGVSARAPSSSSPLVFRHVFAPEQGLVRPVEKPFRREICLNGLWRFEPLTLPHGYQRGAGPPPLPAPRADSWSKTPIRIPSPWDVNGFASGNGSEFVCFPTYPKSWNAVQMGWLKTTFKIPPSWKGKQIYLHFMSIIGAARIVVNGHLLANHFNSFLPFEVDLTKTIQFDRPNELLVGVRGPHLFEIPGPYQSLYPYPTGSFWGMQVAGIDQDVFLQARPRLHVARLFIQPLVAKNILRVRVRVSNGSLSRQSFRLAAKVRPWTWLDRANELTAPECRSALGRVVLRFTGPREELAAGQSGDFTLQVVVRRQLALWSLRSPQLYGLIVALRQHKVTQDRKYARFGWRQWLIRGRQLLLNGHPVRLRGDAWHFMGVPEMTPRYAWAWFTMLKQAHSNAVRLTVQPFPPFFFQLADQMGIAVLDESGIHASHCRNNYWQPATWRRFRRALRAQVLRDRNHACVFGWSVANEVVPALRFVVRRSHASAKVLARAETMVFGRLGRLARMVEKMDPTRPWVSSDGDGDLQGRLPVFVAHYGRPSDWAAWVANPRHNRPFAVGECTETYYSSGPMVARLEGDRAYINLHDYMQGLANQAYRYAAAERKLCAYGSLWNLVWYGLKPLPLGLANLHRRPNLHDGIFFGSFVPHVPGMQPERLGPYCTTLNPGYDPHLPLFEPWSFWRAVRAARAPGGPQPSRWAKLPAPQPLPRPLPPVIDDVQFAGAVGGKLHQELAALQVPLCGAGAPAAPLLILDARSLSARPRPTLDRAVRRVIARGGKVLVLEVTASSLAAVNRLLPAPIMLTNRRAVSLLPNRQSAITAPLSLGQLYFAQDKNPYILDHGMAGPLVKGGRVLLKACGINWLAWTRKPEYLKTAAAIESERQAKPSGAALVEYAAGAGQYLVSTLRLVSPDPRKVALLRSLLVDMRVALVSPNGVNVSPAHDQR